MGLLVTFAFWAATFLISRWLAPKVTEERAKPDGFGKYSAPRAEEGSPIPLFWGRVKVSPMLVWAGGWDPNPIVIDGRTVGYSYRLSMQMILGIPGGTFYDGGSPQTKLVQFLVNDRPVEIAGPMSGPEDASLIDHPTFLGGLGAGGGIRGTLAFYPGSLDQDYTSSAGTDFVAEWTSAGYDEDYLPAYRGQAMITLRRFEIGESSNPPTFSAVVLAPTRVDGLGAEIVRELLDGSANPVAVVYDILTSSYGRVNVDPARIDNDSFYAAAQTLKDERHGFSLVLYNGKDAREVIKEILAEIDAVLYEDPSSKLVTIKLIREDYDVGDLPEFDETNVLSVVNYATTAWSETYNEVRVVYTDRHKNFEPRTAYAQNAALIAAMGGRVRALQINYPGILDAALADKVAARELSVHGRPLAKVRLACNRDAYTLRPGDVFKFSWSEYGLTNRVFRVVKFDLGAPGNERVVIDAVEDRFYAGISVYDQPTWETVRWPVPCPSTERSVMEAPWFFQYRSVAVGQGNDSEVQRLFHVAAPQDDEADYYRARIEWQDGGGSWAWDTLRVNFPGRFRVATAYPRHLEPYDTSTGLVIEALEGATLAEAGTASIRFYGHNLLLIGSEILAYETFQDLGGGQYLLENVWRGLCDTVPVDHAVGDRGYVIGNSIVPLTGDYGFGLDQVVEVKLLAGNGLSFVAEEDTPADAITITLRSQLPVRPTDVTVQGSKQPSALEEEGVDVAWKRRVRQATQLDRGDDSSEAPGETTTYDVVGRKLEGTYAGTTVILENLVDGDSADDVQLSEVGHGTIQVGVRARRPIPGGGLTTYYAHQIPEVPIEAKPWRNLLRNASFDDPIGLDRWTVVDGDVQSSLNTSEALGRTRRYVETNGAADDYEIRQIVRVHGYLPERLKAILDFYDSQTSGSSDDTLTVHLTALDDADTELQTTTHGPTAPAAATWAHRRIEIDGLPSGTTKLRVRVLGDALGELDTTPNVIVSDIILRLGQVTDQLLTNPGFESGSTTGWTNVTNSFALRTSAGPYDGTYHVRAGSFASSEIRQDATIPDGYTYGTAVLEFSLKGDVASNTDEAQVILEARDGSGVVATTQIDPQVFVVEDLWFRYRLTLEIPGDATTLRVRLLGERNSGTQCNVCFDDFDLRVHKHLDPDHSYSVRFDEPAEQVLPTSDLAWCQAYPTIPAPDLAYDGTGTTFAMGHEEGLEWEADTSGTGSQVVVLDTRMVGVLDGDTVEVSAVEIRDGSAYALRVQDIDFANWTADHDWSVVVVLKGTPRHVGGTEVGIIGRIGTYGWGVKSTDDDVGAVQAVIRGRDGEVTVDGTAPILHGGVQFFALVHRAADQEVDLYDPAGVTTEDVSPAGDFRGEVGLQMVLGLMGAVSLDTGFSGQVARVYVWRRHALTSGQVGTFWRHGTAPADGLTLVTPGSSHARLGAVDVGLDGEVKLAEWQSDQHPWARRQALADDGGTGLGLVLNRAVKNLAPVAPYDENVWTSVGATLFLGARTSPTGRQDGILTYADNGERLVLNHVAWEDKPAVRVVWWARLEGGSSRDARISLASAEDSSEHDHQDYEVTAEWQRFEHVFDTTATSFLTSDGMELWFHATNTGTPAGPGEGLIVCPIVLVTHEVHDPVEAIPCHGRNALATGRAWPVAYDWDPGTVDDQVNAEGELVVEGTCAEGPQAGTVVDAHNDVDSDDRRTLRVAGSVVEFRHHAGNGLYAVSYGEPGTWEDVWALRARWQRAELFDQADAYGGLIVDGGAAEAACYGRVATWAQTLVPLETVSLGHADAVPASTFSGVLRSVSLVSRETKLEAWPAVEHVFDFDRPSGRFVKPSTFTNDGLARYFGLPSMAARSCYLLEDAAASAVVADSMPSPANLTYESTVMRRRRMTGLWDGESWDGVIGVEFPNWTDSIVAASSSVHEYGNVSFGGVLVFKSAGLHGLVTGLVGKTDTGAGNRGFRIDVNTNGTPQLILHDGTNSATRTMTINHCDGAWHYLVWWVNRSTNMMGMFSDLEKPTDVSIASVGDATGSGVFSLGQGRTTTYSNPCQMALAVVCDGINGLAESSSFDDWWRRVSMAGHPGMDTPSRTNVYGSEMPRKNGSDAMHVFGPKEIPWAWRDGLGTSSECGVHLSGTVTNLLTEADVCKSAWAVSGTATKTTPLGTNPSGLSELFDDPRGMRWAARLTKTAANGKLRQAVSLTSGTTYTFSVWLMVPSAEDPVIEFRDSTDTTTLATATCDYGPIGSGRWRRWSLTYTAASTATHYVVIHPDTPAATSGTCYVQYAQVETGDRARAFAYSNGASKTTTNPAIKSTLEVVPADTGRIDWSVWWDATWSTTGAIGGAEARYQSAIYNLGASTTLVSLVRDSGGSNVAVHTRAGTFGALRHHFHQWSSGTGVQTGWDVSGGSPAELDTTSDTWTAAAADNLVIGTLSSLLAADAVVTRAKVTRVYTPPS